MVTGVKSWSPACLWKRVRTLNQRLQKLTKLKTPSKIKWDLINGPLSNLLELLDTQVFSGSVQWVLLEISCKT